MSICMQAFRHIGMYAYGLACMDVCTYVHVRAHMHMYAHAYMYACRCMYSLLLGTLWHDANLTSGLRNFRILKKLGQVVQALP